MLRYLLMLAWLPVVGQSTEGPKFEVASVKRMGPTSPNMTPVGLVSPTRFAATAVASAFVVRAFDVSPFLIVNLDKAPNEFYEITATLPDGATKDDVPVMLRNLLIERFHLRHHRETRDVKQFELRVAETGHKMKDVSSAPAIEPSAGSVSNKPGSDGYVEFLPGRNMGPVGFAGRWGMQRIGITMSEFANELPGRWLNGVVTDLTGLTGKYTFTLKWSDRLAAASTDGATAPEFSDPPFQVALRQQLGLVVRETKGPADVIVIENMDREATRN